MKPSFDPQIILEETLVHRVFHFEEITSTNDYAKTLLSESDNNGLSRLQDEPLLIIADCQTKGRGQGTHQWWSPQGSLAMTLLTTWTRLSMSRTQSAELSLFVAAAVRDTIAEFIAHSEYNFLAPVIKHPNDILVEGKKISGILIESPNPNAVIIGIGVGVNNRIEDAPEHLLEIITTLKTLIHRETNMTLFCKKLINRIL